MLQEDGTEVQWAHTTGATGSGIQYDMKQPIALKAPPGMIVVLITHKNPIFRIKEFVHNTYLNEVPDVHRYLLEVGDSESRGLGGLFYMTAAGHVWDYQKSEFVAKAVSAG